MMLACRIARAAVSGLAAQEVVLQQSHFSLRPSSISSQLPFPSYRYQAHSRWLRSFSSSFVLSNDAPPAAAESSEAPSASAEGGEPSREKLLSLLEELGEDLGGDNGDDGEPLSEADQESLKKFLLNATEASDQVPQYEGNFGPNATWDINQFPKIVDNRDNAHKLIQPYFVLRDKAFHSEQIGEELYNQDDIVAAAIGTLQPNDLSEFVLLRCGFARPLSDEHIRLLEKRIMRIAEWLSSEQIAVFMELFCSYSREYNVKPKTPRSLTDLLLNFPEIEFRTINSIIETTNVAKFPLSKKVGMHLYQLLKKYSDNGDQWEDDIDVYFSDEDEQEQQAN